MAKRRSLRPKQIQKVFSTQDSDLKKTLETLLLIDQTIINFNGPAYLEEIKKKPDNSELSELLSRKKELVEDNEISLEKTIRSIQKQCQQITEQQNLDIQLIDLYENYNLSYIATKELEKYAKSNINGAIHFYYKKYGFKKELTIPLENIEGEYNRKKLLFEEITQNINPTNKRYEFVGLCFQSYSNTNTPIKYPPNLNFNYLENNFPISKHHISKIKDALEHPFYGNLNVEFLQTEDSDPVSYFFEINERTDIYKELFLRLTDIKNNNYIFVDIHFEEDLNKPK